MASRNYICIPLSPCFRISWDHINLHLSLNARVVWHYRWFHNQVPSFFSVLHCPLGLCELQACPFPDVVLPPLLLSALSSSSFPPQGGAADTELKVPSDQNTELKRSPFKPWSRSVYSHTCYAYCKGVLPGLFLPFRSIHLHFFQIVPIFSCVGCC